jgi:hypothetical protein
MKFGPKDVIIGLIVLVILFLLFVKGRRLSFADMAAPAPSPVAIPPAAQLPSGSILGKTVDEDCSQKYGAGWSKFTDTLCKKE